MPIQIDTLPASREYQGSDGQAIWEGYLVTDEEAFREFLAGPVNERSEDADAQDSFEDELRALATTGVETEFLEGFFQAVPEETGWEIGEAFAETALSMDQNREVIWPWNERRDRRTPQASLPGADLVGFCRDDDGVVLLFGEVKTSADASTPPNVMYGRSGMTWQLEQNATRLDVQHTLLRWLRLRCETADLVAIYREAATRYLKSSGTDLLVIGVLLRDTSCNEKDIRSRAKHLADRLAAPTRIEVYAWYLPVSISSWPEALGGAA